MRVTQNMMSHSIILHLQRQNEQLYDLQTKIATQKRLNKPSDDPTGMAKVLDYRSQLAVIDQYQNNITNGTTRFESNDLTLDLISDLIRMARELGQEYSDQNMTPAQKQIAAQELQEIYDQIVNLANSKFENDYIFSGHQTDTPPFSNQVEITGGVPADLSFG